MRPLRLPVPLLFALAVLPVISFLLHFHGTMLFGWDSLPPLRPELALRSALTAWSWNADLGQPNAFDQLTQIPVALLYWLLALPFGIAFAQKLILVALFVLPAFTMYACARRLFPHSPVIAFASAWCYALCPLLFVRYYIPILPVQLVYGLLPLLVNVWVDLLRRGADAPRLLALGLVEAAMWPCTGNFAYWLVPQLAAFFFALIIAVAQAPSRRVRDVQRIGAGVAVIVLVNLFWFVPQVLLGVKEGAALEHESVTQAYSAGIRKDVAKNSSLSYTLRLTSRAQTTAGDSNGTYWTDAEVFKNPWFSAAMFGWILLAVYAIARRSRDRRVVALAVLLVVALFVMKGESAPFASVLAFAYRIPLAGTMFRDGFDKLLPMAAFPLALLVPIGVLGAGGGPWIAVRQVALMLAVFLMAVQFWTGQMFMARPKGPTLASMPPAEIFDFGHMLDNADARVLALPGSDNSMLTATTWRYYGSSPFVGITGAPLIPYAASAKNRPETDEVTTALYQAVAAGDLAAFRALAQDADVGYVFVAHDIDPSYYGGMTPSQVDTFMAHISGTHIAAIAGPYTLWKLPDVPAMTHDLVRREMIGYDTPLDTALAVASRCGSATGALIPQIVGACTLRGVGTPPDAAWLQMTAAVAGSRLTLELPSAKTNSAVLLPPQTSVARIHGEVIGRAPFPILLVPCSQYAVQSFRSAGALRNVALGSAPPDGDVLQLPLGPIAPGFTEVAVRALADRSNVAAQVTDALTGQVMTTRTGMYTGANELVFYALPGRSYQLEVSGQVAFGHPRDDVAGVTVTPVARTGITTLVAPPSAAAPCVNPATDRAYIVRNKPLDAALVVYRRALLVRAYGIEAPFDVFTLPLPRGTTMARNGDDFIESTAVDESFVPGLAVTLQDYRAGGSASIVPISDLQSSGVLVSDLDAPRGRMTLQTYTANQWVRIDVPAVAPGDYSITVDSSGLLGFYGAAVTDSASTVLAAKRGVRGPRISLALHARTGLSNYLYIYIDPGQGQTGASLRIASISMQPIVPTGVASFVLPRALPTVPSTPGAVLVSGAVTSSGAPIAGDHLAPEPVPTAIVLDTQFDPFWQVVGLQPRFPFIWRPAHAVADGYKNAWIVPAGSDGLVFHFYVLTVLGYGLFVVALATLLFLFQRCRIVASSP